MKVQDKKQNRKRRIRRTMFLFFLLLLIAGVYVSYRYYWEDKRQEEKFDELEEWENNPIPSLASDNVNNPDWIGWLKIKHILSGHAERGRWRILSSSRF